MSCIFSFANFLFIFSCLLLVLYDLLQYSADETWMKCLFPLPSIKYNSESDTRKTQYVCINGTILYAFSTSHLSMLHSGWNWVLGLIWILTCVVHFIIYLIWLFAAAWATNWYPLFFSLFISWAIIATSTSLYFQIILGLRVPDPDKGYFRNAWCTLN